MSDKIKELEQQLEQLKAQANVEIGRLLGKIELLKAQEKEGDEKVGDKETRPDMVKEDKK